MGAGAHLQSTLPFSRPTAGNFPVVGVGGGEGDMGTDTYDVRRNGLKKAHRASERRKWTGRVEWAHAAMPVHSRNSAHSWWAWSRSPH